MKNVKFALMAAAAFVGLASAYASNNRTTFTYVNEANNGTYVLIGTYDAAKCKTDATRPCSFVTTISQGSSTTQHALTLAGAVPSSLQKVYVP